MCFCIINPIIEIILMSQMYLLQPLSARMSLEEMRMDDQKQQRVHLWSFIDPKYYLIITVFISSSTCLIFLEAKV